MYDIRTTYKVAVLIRACIVEYRTLSLLLTAGQLQIFFFFFNNYNANNGHEMFVFQSKLIGCQSWQNWIGALVALGNVNVYYLMDLDFLFGHSTFCFFFFFGWCYQHGLQLIKICWSKENLFCIIIILHNLKVRGRMKTIIDIYAHTQTHTEYNLNWNWQ